jgi:hypothetical protein
MNVGTYGDSEEMFEVHAMPGEIIPAGEKRMILSDSANSIDVPGTKGRSDERDEKTLLLLENRVQRPFQHSKNHPIWVLFLRESDNRPEAMYRSKSRAYNYTDQPDNKYKRRLSTQSLPTGRS